MPPLHLENAKSRFYLIGVDDNCAANIFAAALALRGTRFKLINLRYLEIVPFSEFATGI